MLGEVIVQLSSERELNRIYVHSIHVLPITISIHSKFDATLDIQARF